jgi:hypothetical protein
VGKVRQRNKNWKEDNEQLMSPWKTIARAENRKEKCNEPGLFEMLGDCSSGRWNMISCKSVGKFEKINKIDLR